MVGKADQDVLLFGLNDWHAHVQGGGPHHGEDFHFAFLSSARVISLRRLTLAPGLI